MSEWFHVGQKVQCIDDRPHYGLYEALPVLGKVYTIRAISRWRWPEGNEGVGVWLEELIRPLGSHGYETPWTCSRFRPLRKRTTDISIFTRLLAPEKQPA